MTEEYTLEELVAQIETSTRMLDVEARNTSVCSLAVRGWAENARDALPDDLKSQLANVVNSLIRAISAHTDAANEFVSIAKSIRNIINEGKDV